MIQRGRDAAESDALADKTPPIKAPLEENDTLGVIAGAGAMPIMVVRSAKEAGKRVVVVGLRGLADPVLREMADAFYWSGIPRVGRFIRIFLRAKAYRMILAGSVTKSAMYGRFRLLRYLPDWTTIKCWFFRAPDKRTDSLLGMLADVMSQRGIHMEHCVKYCMDAMAKAGVWTRSQPSAAQLKDIEFGWAIAKEMGRLDIGQSIAVKEQEVIAVEAIEGTDRMLERAGQLCRSGGWALIKVAKPNQDMRFDVPTVGAETIENLRRHGGRMLVIEAEKTFVIDREQMVARAERYGIVIVARQDRQVDSK